MTNIRAILFDKDGTLLDFNATWFDFVREMALEAAGGDEIRCDELLGLAGFDHVSRTFRSGSAVAAGTSADIVEILYPAASKTDLVALTKNADRLAAEVALRKAVALPGVIGALGKLHTSGYRMGIATNDSTAGAEATLVKFGIAHMFDAAYGYDAVANPKPAPDVILAFADTVSVTPDQVAMVGDNSHDLEAARAAGAGLSVGVLSGNSEASDLKPLANIVIESVADLPTALNEYSAR